MPRVEERSSFSAPASTDVQTFYEGYPYPRPINDLEAYRTRWQDPQRRRADHYLHWPGRPYAENHSILVAGCGTSQAAKHAIRWPAAQVTGIDFSATSVRCTRDMKRKYRLDNLDVHQLPIEQVAELGARFDQIICTGVLHHLSDPEAGLRALHDVLEPDGALHLMVYAPYGRTGIYMMQEFCRTIGMRATDEEIRSLIGALKLLPKGHPLTTLLREAPDFRNEAALADALLNPQDRAYSVAQLFELLGSADVTFGRWVRQAPYRADCGVMRQLPQHLRIAGLPLEQQYAMAEIVRGTMVRHSLIAYRTDGSSHPFVTSFDGHAWQQYVPIRFPDTIVVEEGVPRGAVAVAINRTHTYQDLYLPIDAAEKRLFDAIDGMRSIGEIARAHGDAGVARSLFERLWWYDQIILDASSTGPDARNR